MARCLLGLGSNLGDRHAMLRQATRMVASLEGCQLLARSRWHETAPIGGPAGQGSFLNGALLLECLAPPQELATALQSIELRLGRERVVRWDARAIDIDLLLFGSQVIASPELTVPHPRMSFREFVLQPAAEIAGSMVDPASGWALSRLLSYLREAARYVAVASAAGAISGWLSGELCRELHCLQLEETCRACQAAGDSEAPIAVEFNEWALAGLSKRNWQEDAELSKRLPLGRGGTQNSLPPVVSAFWFDAIFPGGSRPSSTELVPTQRGKASEALHLDLRDLVRPALVITVEPKSKKTFCKKICTKKSKAHSILPDLPQASFREILNRKGHGPMARIQADDPGVVLQEAIAAIQSVWPELSISSADESS